MSANFVPCWQHLSLCLCFRAERKTDIGDKLIYIGLVQKFWNKRFSYIAKKVKKRRYLPQTAIFIERAIGHDVQ